MPSLPPALAAHGHSPFEDLGVFGWTLGVVAAVVSVWVIARAVRCTFRPGEEEADHPKRLIFVSDAGGPASFVSDAGGPASFVSDAGDPASLDGDAECR